MCTCLSSHPLHIVRNKGMLLSNTAFALECFLPRFQMTRFFYDKQRFFFFFKLVCKHNAKVKAFKNITISVSVVFKLSLFCTAKGKLSDFRLKLAVKAVAVKALRPAVLVCVYMRAYYMAVFHCLL